MSITVIYYIHRGWSFLVSAIIMGAVMIFVFIFLVIGTYVCIYVCVCVLMCFSFTDPSHVGLPPPRHHVSYSVTVYCMYVYVCMYVCICMYVCMYVCTYVRTYVRVCMYLYVCICMYVRDATILQYIDILQYSLLQYNTPDEEYRYTV